LPSANPKEEILVCPEQIRQTVTRIEKNRHDHLPLAPGLLMRIEKTFGQQNRLELMRIAKTIAASASAKTISWPHLIEAAQWATDLNWTNLSPWPI